MKSPQTLVGINIHLAALTLATAGDPRVSGGRSRGRKRLMKISEHCASVRPGTAPGGVDDLGLIPALHTFMKEFTKQTGIHIHFKTFTSGRIRQLNNATRTVFYRVARKR